MGEASRLGTRPKAVSEATGREPSEGKLPYICLMLSQYVALHVLQRNSSLPAETSEYQKRRDDPVVTLEQDNLRVVGWVQGAGRAAATGVAHLSSAIFPVEKGKSLLGWTWRSEAGGGSGAKRSW